MSRRPLIHGVSQLIENKTVFCDSLLSVGISMVHILMGWTGHSCGSGVFDRIGWGTLNVP